VEYDPPQGTFGPNIPPAPRHLHLVDGNPGNGELPDFVPKPSFNEQDVSDKPPFIQGQAVMTPEDAADVGYQYKSRLGAMLAVDDLVGTVADALAQTGELDNTVLVFTSDNGWLYGEHRLSRKIVAYEESIRVPLIIRGPGFAQGAVSDRIVLNTDLAPTITEVAGAAAGRPFDGRSLVPLLDDPAGAAWTRQQFLVEFWPVSSQEPASYLPPAYAALRRQTEAADSLFVEWYEGVVGPTFDKDNQPSAVTAREYYDLSSDPCQLSSMTLSQAAAQAGHNLLQEFRKAAGSDIRLLEDS
jgi:hypothetical protein